MGVQAKICGITSIEDAVAAAGCGADFIGLNFYLGSKRYVSEAVAKLIVDALPAAVTPVGLFVNESWERIRVVIDRLSIRLVQVHGEKFEPCPFADVRWLPAISVRDLSSLAMIDELVRRDAEKLSEAPNLAGVLLDAHVPGAYGGTGRRAPWDLVAGFRSHLPIMLAGGLTPENVGEAIRVVRPWAVDVASGVESSPGIKDHDKMRRFIENARAAE